VFEIEVYSNCASKAIFKTDLVFWYQYFWIRYRPRLANDRGFVKWSPVWLFI